MRTFICAMPSPRRGGRCATREFKPATNGFDATSRWCWAPAMAGSVSAEAEYAWKHGRSPRPFDERMNLQAQLLRLWQGDGQRTQTSAARPGWSPPRVPPTTVALGLAQRLINRGYYDTVLVGGADVLCVANMSGFDSLKATAPGRMAPFSTPYGMNVGEGDMLLGRGRHGESAAPPRALSRPAGPRDDFRRLPSDHAGPAGPGGARTLRQALEDSGLALADIG